MLFDESLLSFSFVFTVSFFYCRVCSLPSLPPLLKNTTMCFVRLCTDKKALLNHSNCHPLLNKVLNAQYLARAQFDSNAVCAEMVRLGYRCGKPSFVTFSNVFPLFFKARHLLLYFCTLCLLFDRQDWESAATSVPVSTMQNCYIVIYLVIYIHYSKISCGYTLT